MFLILSLIILVAALNIVSGLIMLVKDKSPTSPSCAPWAPSRGAVMRVFLIAGASIGVTGTLLGFVIGVVFCANIESIRQGLSRLTGTTLFDPTIYFLSRMPAEMDAGRGDGGGGDGADADLPGHALSVLAGGAARSGRGAAL